MHDAGSALDDPARGGELKRLIRSKPALRRLYLETYARYAACLQRCPAEGLAVELGSGASFVKDVLPEVVTSDVIPYPDVDRVVDGTKMPFEPASVRALFLLNVLHHIPDVAAFLREAERVLRPGGRVLIADQYPGWIGGLVFKHLHHEPFDATTTEWRFPSKGPLSDANGALAWIVFERDRERFRREHAGLQLAAFDRHTPLRYWLAGGLKRWSLLPNALFGLATWFDRALVAVSPRFGSFVDIELVRV
ncbi:MAG TPA: class I SAM-dependent methyltransferase [Planctomycetota bacterium]|nr:class I SAM-dependent methyltransferase [Planctomycetota bacterium]